MNKEAFKEWRLLPSRDRKPLVMGIVNMTPDSFSNDGFNGCVASAIAHAHALMAAGADIIDIGGESTRPGAKPVSVDEELIRVLPVIRALSAESDVCISVDTTKAAVMHAAILAGATLINDISALSDEACLPIIKEHDVPVCLMHCQGIPETMQIAPLYPDGVIQTIERFFDTRIKACIDFGLKAENIILDPGFGFGKTLAHNMCIIKNLGQFKVRREQPLLIGFSRKHSLGVILDKPPEARVLGGVALTGIAVLQGADIIRTHDVYETKQAVKIGQAVLAV